MEVIASLQSHLKSPPDLSFPSLYNISAPEDLSNSTPRTPPDLSFPPKYYLDPYTNTISLRLSPTNYRLERIVSSADVRAKQPNITPASPTTNLNASPSIEDLHTATKQSPLLELPYEIRLQIYSLVLDNHPIHNAHLAPPPETSNDNLPAFHHMLQPQGFGLPIATSNSSFFTKPASGSRYQSTTHPYRTSHRRTTQAKIPTGLLASCKQIYEETRMLPWKENEFSFVNWFWSGVYAARQFTRALRPWQQEAMRWVKVEVLARDLEDQRMCKVGAGVGGGTTAGNRGDGEWRELCSLWSSGVRGLRLAVRGSVVAASSGWNRAEGPLLPTENDKAEEDRKVGEAIGILDVKKLWVTEGLMKMRALRWVEVEIEDEDVDGDVKERFCEMLEAVLNQEKDGGEEVRVFLLQREQEVEVMSEVSEYGFLDGGNVVPWMGGGFIG